ncbi:MgtC/SapB family protein [Paenibacillus sambharensis]
MPSIGTDPWFISEMQVAVRLFVAVLLGGLIGFEREQNNHAAGLRTHIMVCMGSCLLMLLSAYGFAAFAEETNVRMDPARLAAAVITGIGFLGAGTILHTGKSITGLTTAASIWVVSAIGLSVGAGFYFASISATIIVLFTLWALNKAERRFMNGKKERVFVIMTDKRADMLEKLQGLLLASGIMVRKASMQTEIENGMTQDRHVIRLHLSLRKQEEPLSVMEKLHRVEGVQSISME